MNNIMLGIVLVALLGGGLVVAMKYSSTTSQNLQKGEIVQSAPTIAPLSSSQITLIIRSPATGQTVNTASVTVRGNTVPKAEVAVNDVNTVADGNGDFSSVVNLDEGDNEIVIIANDVNGNFAEQTVNITYDSSQ